MSTLATDTLLVTGLPGSRHEEHAAAIAEYFDASLVSTDELVSAELGTSIGEAFVVHGEDSVRACELLCTRRVLDTASDRSRVVVVGSGLVDSDEGASLLANKDVVFFDCQVREAMKNLGMGVAVALGVNPRATWVRMASERRPRYESIARHVFDESTHSADVCESLAAG